MTTTSSMYVWMALFVAMVETGLETICLAAYHNDCKIGKTENAAPGDFGCMYMSKYVSSKVTIVRDATDSTTRRAVIRLPGMHSVKQLNLRGLGGASLRADHFLDCGRGPLAMVSPTLPTCRA